MAIEWDECMVLGIKEIDEEHKEWVRRYNEFDDAVMSNRGKEMMEVALRFFEQYTEFHFPNEEWWATNHLSEGIEKNKEEHNIMRYKLAEMKSKICCEDISMVEVMELQIEMEQWIVKHICETDKNLFVGRN